MIESVGNLIFAFVRVAAAQVLAHEAHAEIVQLKGSPEAGRGLIMFLRGHGRAFYHTADRSTYRNAAGTTNTVGIYSFFETSRPPILTMGTIVRGGAVAAELSIET